MDRDKTVAGGRASVGTNLMEGKKEMEVDEEVQFVDELLTLFNEKFMNEPQEIIDLDKWDRTCGQEKCLNPLCESGAGLVAAPSTAKAFYSIPGGKSLLICQECLLKAMNFHCDLAQKLLKKEPVWDVDIPVNAEVIIVDDDEDEASDSKLDPAVRRIFEEVTDDIVVKLDKMFAIKDQYENGLHLIKSEYTELNDLMKQASALTYDNQNTVVTMMKELYDAFAPSTSQLPPLEIDYEEMRSQTLKWLSEENEDCILTGQLSDTGPDTIPPLGTILLPKPKVGDRMYAMKVSVFSEWVPSRVEEVILRTSENGKTFYLYKVVLSGADINPGFKREVSPQLLAYYDPPTVRIPVGTRVIAEYVDVFKGPNTVKFYSGIVAEMPSHINNFRYLMFFDDGKEQYVNHSSLRLVCSCKPNVWEHFIKKLQPFIKCYVTNFPERGMVKVKNLDSLKAEYKGMWVNARVVAIDGSLVKLIFLHDKHSEWIYRGSYRLYPIHSLNQRKRGLPGRPRGISTRPGPYVQYDIVLSDDEDKSPSQPARAVARKSSTRLPDFVEIEQTRRLYERRASRSSSAQQQNDGVIEQRYPVKIVRPKPYRPHVCSNTCVSWVEVRKADIKGSSPLVVPISYGFERDTESSARSVSYISPCGRRLITISEVLKYLTETRLKLSIDMFDFDPWINIFNEYVVANDWVVLKDLSFGIENIPVVCVNRVNGKVPTYMDYMTARRGSEGVNLNTDPEFLIGCDCTDNCQDKEKCACWQLTMAEGNCNIISKKRGFQSKIVGYQYKRLPNLVATGIYECNSRCKCCVKTCLNRVVQHPLQHKLQLFMTKNKGWGTRCLNDIPAGAFICVYVGNIFTEAVANEDGRLYGDEYFAELDYIEVVEANKEGYEDFVDPEEYLDDIKNDSADRITDDEFEPDDWAPSTSHNMNLRKRADKKNPPSTQENNSEEEDDPDEVEPSQSSEPHFDFTGDEETGSRPSVRTYYGENESVYIMDAKAAGNIGRYLNHSCDPNIFVQNVFVDTHDLRFPWVAFFSLKSIQAGTELTWDYRYEVGSVPGKKLRCHCASLNCRGRLL